MLPIIARPEKNYLTDNQIIYIAPPTLKKPLEDRPAYHPIYGNSIEHLRLLEAARKKSF